MTKAFRKLRLLKSSPTSKAPRIEPKELELAKEIQKHLLPKHFPLSDVVEIGTIYEPSKHIGGDFYDVVQLDTHRIAYIIGDVSGHGIPAALFMTQCMSLIRAHIKMDLSLAKVLEKTNKMLYGLAKPDMFATVFIGIYDSFYNHFTYINAGHNPPLLVRTSWDIPTKDFHPLMMLTAEGMALNCVPELHLEEKKLQLYAGDLVLLYTDGLIDATNVNGESFGESKLKGLLTELKNESAAIIAERMYEHLTNFTKDTKIEKDDMAALILKFKS